MSNEKDPKNIIPDTPEPETPMEGDFVEPKIPNSEDLNKWLKNNLARELSAPKNGGNGWIITEVRPDDNTVTLIRHNFSGQIDKITVDKTELFLENRHLNERNGWKPTPKNATLEEVAEQSIEEEKSAPEYESVLDKAAKIDLVKAAVEEEKLYNPDKSTREIIDMMRNFDGLEGGWFGDKGITNEHFNAVLADLEKEESGLVIEKSSVLPEEKNESEPENPSEEIPVAIIADETLSAEDELPKPVEVEQKDLEAESNTLLITEEEFEQLKSELTKQMEEILNGAYIEAEEALRAKERYGKTKVISWLKEKLGTERIRVNSNDGIGLEISSGKDRRWWNPVIKVIIGGSAAFGTMLATPSIAVGLGAFGAAYLARAAVETLKLGLEKKNGIHQTIESSYIAKYQKALELAERAKGQENTDNKAFANSLLEMQNFIDSANDEAVEKYLGAKARENVKNLTIAELEEKQKKSDRKWKIAESIAGLTTSFGAGIALHAELAQSLISGNAEAVKKFAENIILENFNGGDIMHQVMKTKDGWVFLYNDIGEPARIAEAMGTTKWLDKLTILDYGEFGAHSVGEHASAILEGQLDKFTNALNIDAAEALSSARGWLTGVLGALSIQTGYEVFSNLKGKSATKAKEAYDNLSQEKTKEEAEPTNQEELDDLKFKSSTSKEKEKIINQIFKEAEKTKLVGKNSEGFTEELEQVEPIQKEILRLKEKWVGKSAQININASEEKKSLSIQLDGRNYPIELNPSALLAVSRSNNSNLNFSVQIQDFVKEGQFIHAKGATSTLDPKSLEETLGIEPEQTLENLKSDYIGKRIDIVAKTATMGDKEFTAFILSSKESPAMQDINYIFQFPSPNATMNAKHESDQKSSVSVTVKDIELRYDSKTDEPVYIFKV